MPIEQIKLTRPGSWNRLAGFKTKVERDMDTNAIAVTYHQTTIVAADSIQVVLDTGGWRTVTTKRKLNQAANQFDLPYSVHQDRYQWFVTTKAGTFEWNGDEFAFDRASGVPFGMSMAELAVNIAAFAKKRNR